MIPLATVLGSVVGKKVIDKILDCVERVIPMNEDQKSKLELELLKVEVENLKAKTDYVNSLGYYLKEYVMPAGIGLFFFFHTINFFTAWILTLLGKEAFTIGIDSGFVEVIKTVVMFFFGYKGFKGIARK